VRPPATPKIDFLIVVALGGALGAVARYELVKGVHVNANGVPWGTFIANQTGAFVLAVFLTYFTVRARTHLVLHAFVAIGFLGAYTTFSSMAMETVLLVKNHHALVGIGYLAGSIIVGLAVATLGVAIMRATLRTRP
jgi:fluoride exporter